MAGIDEHALERWMYRKNGMDYGPFSVHDLHELIRTHAIDGDTEVRNLRERRLMRLQEVPHLRVFLEEFRRKEAEDKRRREILREAEVLEKSIRRHHRMPILLAVGGTLALGVGLFFALRPSEQLPPGFDLDLFRPMVLGTLPAVPKAPPGPVVAVGETEEKKVRKVARPNPRPGAAPMSPSALPTVDLSFDDEVVSGGRVPTNEDFAWVKQRVSPGLLQCFREEARERPDFRGGTVWLYILVSGRVALSRLVTTPPASTRLLSCAMAAVKGVQIPPFTGGAQVMEIPFYVSGVR